MAEETRKDVLQKVVGLAKSELKGWEDKASKTLEQYDIEPNMHVGQSTAFFEEDADRVIEWLLGQMSEMLRTEDENIKYPGIKHMIATAEEFLKGETNGKTSKNVQK